jgi:hypothetical protein
MNTEYNNPDLEPDENDLSGEAKNAHANIGDTDEEADLAPDTDGQNQVLNDDGSLADLPDQDADGSGAEEGVVGLGT